MSAAVDKRPRVQLLVVGDKPPRHIVLVSKPWRSKYVTVTCFCKRRRKSGTCQRTDPVVAALVNPRRAWIKHPEIDDQRFRVPAPAEDGDSNQGRSEQSAS